MDDSDVVIASCCEGRAQAFDVTIGVLERVDDALLGVEDDESSGSHGG